MTTLYESWRLWVGHRLRVVTAHETFEGVLTGLQTVASRGGLQTNVELPWAISTPGGIRYVDPDNPAIAIFSGDVAIGPPASRFEGERATVDLHAFLRKCEDIVQEAKENSDKAMRLSGRRGGWG